MMISEEIINSYENKICSLKNKNDLLEQRCEQYAQAYDSLLAQIKELQRHRFGKKSERYIDPENPQLSLVDNDQNKFANTDAAGESIVDDVQGAAPTHKRKSKTEKELPIRIEIIPVSDEQKQCSCGKCKKVIRYETKKMVHHQQEVHEIIEQRREVVACVDGCDGEIITAPAPLLVLPKIKATEEFLSFLVVSKLDDRQPLYHLEKQLRERHGIDCSRQTMARWMIDVMFPLRPIYNLLKECVIDYGIASCDATTFQVLNEPGRCAETKSYAYCIRGGDPGNSVVLYEYNDVLHKQFVKEWFEGFNGYLHVDGDNFLELVGEFASLVNCNSHARRKFEPIAQGTKGKGLAKEALRYFKELYKIEREAKDKELTPDQRHALRQEKSKPLTEKFKQWLDEMYPTTLPQSPLGKALNYCIKLWAGLTRFLEDGRLEIDNNLTEQQIKPFVIARKNFLFASSVDGADALCMHMSIIRTTKEHGHDPYHYYVKLLKSIPHCKTVEDYEKLLPWNIAI
ncbi:MAG: IS66 family transposase [Candidatus Babeliales bacterium]|nr:IS66 family transposase [Candidatus Babeliales bacterium]